MVNCGQLPKYVISTLLKSNTCSHLPPSHTWPSPSRDDGLVITFLSFVKDGCSFELNHCAQKHRCTSPCCCHYTQFTTLYMAKASVNARAQSLRTKTSLHFALLCHYTQFTTLYMVASVNAELNHCAQKHRCTSPCCCHYTQFTTLYMAKASVNARLEHRLVTGTNIAKD
ncbi:hypothetical protein J6590_006105 [Homalodisca vitripennis]|nr:hypothetical protein J6590_006105 [Homalodisca vitripennis]